MIKIEKTIMEVMENKDNELACSNMLAFYLNPLERHNFKYLILKALIKTMANKGLIDEESYKYDENISVIREYQSIDIIILNDDYVIGIENKIDAKLNNDLLDYSNKLKVFKRKMINFVLSKNVMDTNYDTTGWVNITYAEFVEQLDKIMANIEPKNTKWYFYLEDFVINLRNNNTEYQYRKELFKNNKLTDMEIELEIDRIDQEIDEKIKRFKNIINVKKNDTKEIRSKHIIKLDLTAYIGLDGFNLDARLTPYGWTIVVNKHKNIKTPIINTFLCEKNIKILDSYSKHSTIKEFDYNEDIQNVAEYYLKIYELVKKIK